MAQSTIVRSSSSSSAASNSAQYQQQQQQQQNAFADALAGTLASLIALWAFYPMDVIKTRVQAGTTTSIKNNNNSLSAILFQLPSQHPGRGNSSRSSSSSSSIHHSWLELLSGVQWKSLHTACSSFCYFYLYSWIVTQYKKQSQQHPPSHSTDHNSSLSVSARLLLACIAAVLNTFLTLPLDVIAARVQTKAPVVYETTTPSHAGTGAGDGDINEHDDVGAAAPASNQTNGTTSLLKLMQHRDLPGLWRICSRVLRSFKSLWKGLGPSLLLCTNPAIHYTVFDTIKQHVLTRRTNDQHPRHSSGASITTSMSTSEAFVLGLLAKFIATMATYPLIRAKVMLMVTSSSLSRSGSVSSNNHNQSNNNNNNNNNMLTCLWNEYQTNGVVNGLYRGCHLQLLHTLIKSALLMAVRERIGQSTQRFVAAAATSQTTSSTLINNPR
ncbi:hypothetical protein ACA910_020974 [Epithemia clementina (nom. ined.)]